MKTPWFQLMSQQRSQLCHVSSCPHRSVISLLVTMPSGKEGVPAKYFLLQVLIKWLCFEEQETIHTYKESCGFVLYIDML